MAPKAVLTRDQDVLDQWEIAARNLLAAERRAAEMLRQPPYRDDRFIEVVAALDFTLKDQRTQTMVEAIARLRGSLANEPLHPPEREASRP